MNVDDLTENSVENKDMSGVKSNGSCPSVFLWGPLTKPHNKHSGPPLRSKQSKANIMPKPLKEGDCIGIAAPSSPFDKNQFKHGVTLLKKLGFQVWHRDD